jgi:ABC-type glycerol-3-phosphate transport system substrate-binding protein
LLSEEIQETIANNGYNPVNRAAFDSVGDKAVDYYNDMYSDEYFYCMGVGEPSTPDKFSDEDVDAYKKIVESVTTVNTSDASISKIISEEMPAYFSGQKDLDEVVEIMQDRVQKVLDERG